MTHPEAPRPELPPPAPAPAWNPANPSHPLAKNPFVAGMLSIFPGLGNIYNGLYLRGVAFFVAFLSCIGVLAGVDHEGGPMFGLALAFTYIFSIVDAVRQASLINLGLTSDPAATYRPTPLTAGGGSALAGLMLFGLGLLALLDRWFHIDLTWLADAWPLIPMGLGAWLLAAAWRDRSGKAAPSADDEV
jgi:hypothetical protein